MLSGRSTSWLFGVIDPVSNEEEVRPRDGQATARSPRRESSLLRRRKRLNINAVFHSLIRRFTGHLLAAQQ